MAMTFEIAEARSRLDEWRPEELGDLGVVLLAAGHDTPVVREMSGSIRR